MTDPLDELRTDAAARRIGVVNLGRGIIVAIPIAAMIWAIAMMIWAMGSALWHARTPPPEIPIVTGNRLFTGNVGFCYYSEAPSTPNRCATTFPPPVLP